MAAKKKSDRDVGVHTRTGRARTETSRPRDTVVAAVQLDRAGLRLVDGTRTQVVPLRAGAVHYWRIDRRAFRPALTALKTMGVTMVETYVPWQVHERGGDDVPVRYLWDDHLDVAAFLREAHALGLYAIVRPGPHINAELTDFGLPERIVWDSACQARSPRQNPVLLPAPPRAFPVPSYASKTFLAETAKWFAAVGEQLRELVYPKGPIVLVQVDNEGALYFRDGVFDQDYHPDAVARYRRFLAERYRSIEELRRAYDVPFETFDDVPPPIRYDARSAEDLPRLVDWAEAHEVILADAFADMGHALEEAGFSGIPLFHNFPMAESATPLVPSRVRRDAEGRGIDLVTLDYYHTAGDHRAIARRTTELVVSCDALGHPPFAAEMGAGAPPFFPPLDERDAIFTLLCAMAYGLRGYNVYMAVERDRWLGSPIDRDGVLRPFAAFFRKLGAACERVKFAELHREMPVRLVVPRPMRRLARVMHAFGPVSQSAFRVFGGGMLETVIEDGVDFGDGEREPPPIRAGRILVAAERALDEAGVPYAFVDGGDAKFALAGAKFVLVPTACGLDAELREAISAALEAGAHVTYAPAVPTRDGSFRAFPPKTPKGATGANGANTPTVLLGDEATDAALVRLHLERSLQGVPRVSAKPAPCAATVHLDEKGVPRVVFLINPTKTKQVVEAQIPGVSRVTDLFDGTTSLLEDGVSVDAGSVRFCEVIPPG